LVLSGDGQLGRRLSHPSYGIEKVYAVKVNACPSEHDLDRFRRGIHLDDGRTAPADVIITHRLDKKVWLRVSISEGRNLQIRRMFEAIGLHVDKLRRTNIGPLSLGRLPVGATRILRERELKNLSEALGLKGRN